MEDHKVHELYLRYLQNDMDYLRTMKIAGILEEKNDPEAEYVEAEALFLNQQYEKCIQFCESKRTSSSYDINEFHIASLLLLGRYPQVRTELKQLLNATQEHPLGDYCIGYVQSFLELKGERVLPNKRDRIPAIKREDSFFKREYYSFAVKELMSIYEEQQDLSEVYDSNPNERVVMDAITSSNYDFIKRVNFIHIESETKSLILEDLQKGKMVDPMHIHEFLLEGFDMKQLRDIINLIDVERRLRLFDELDSTITTHGGTLFDSIKQFNKTVAMYLIEVSLAIQADGVDLSASGSEILSKCRKEIGKVFPELLEYEKTNIENSRISKYLSERSKVMLKAAIWQNTAVCSDTSYGFRDAGMYCLSYIRLLELEMNEHIIPHLRIHREELMRLYKNLDPAESVSTIESKNKWKKLKRKIDSFQMVWGNIKTLCKENPKGLTAGQWQQFFKIFSEATEDRKEKELYKTLYESMKEVFNEKGMNALQSGRLTTLFDQDEVIEKYRNPPAHTRYVTVKIANECKEHVESTIEELYAYYK